MDDIFFICTDGEDPLKEFLVFYQEHSETKTMKSVINFEISLSTKSTNLIYHRFFKSHRLSHLP